MMTTPEILIAGAGALGSVLGGMLRSGGHEVTLLGRKAHLDAIARDGLRVSGIFGERHATGFSLAENAAKLGRRFDLVLVAVKSYDTESIARSLSASLAEGAVAVSLQNGLGNLEVLARRFGPERTLGGRVIFGAELCSPGVARVTVVAEPVAIGPDAALHGSSAERLLERARTIAQMLSAAGVETEAVSDISPVLWTKLFYNVALNPLGALLQTHYGALGEDPDLRRIMEAAVREAFAVAVRIGVRLPFKDADSYLEHFYQRLLPPTFYHRPSMLYDLENRGRTEIGALNGMVVELAERFGLAAEINRTLTGLIRASERIRKTRLRESA